MWESELIFVYNFFKDGYCCEKVEAKCDSEAFSKLHNMGWEVTYFDKYVRFNRLDNSYDLKQIK